MDDSNYSGNRDADAKWLSLFWKEVNANGNGFSFQGRNPTGLNILGPKLGSYKDHWSINLPIVRCEVKDFEGNNCPNEAEFNVELSNGTLVHLCKQCKKSYEQRNKIAKTTNGLIKI